MTFRRDLRFEGEMFMRKSTIVNCVLLVTNFWALYIFCLYIFKTLLKKWPVLKGKTVFAPCKKPKILTLAEAVFQSSFISSSEKIDRKQLPCVLSEGVAYIKKICRRDV